MKIAAMVRRPGILALLLWGFLALVPVWAGGSAEDPIELARELIIQRKYQEASKILEDLIRNDPERLDDAEALLSTIRDTTRVYNRLTQELVELLENEPENYEGAIALIDEMNRIYENPNPRIQEQLRDARRTAKLQVDRKQRDEIFNAAVLALENAEPAQLVQIYLSGVDLQYPEFLELGLSDDLIARAGELRQRFLESGPKMLSLIDSWRSQYLAYKNEFAAFLGMPQEDMPHPDSLVLPTFGSASLEPEARAGPSTREPSDSPSSLSSQGPSSIGLELVAAREALLLEFDKVGAYLAELEELAFALETLEEEEAETLDHLVFLRQFVAGRSEYGQGLIDSLVHIWAADTLELRDQALFGILQELESAEALRQSNPRRAANLVRVSFFAALDLAMLLDTFRAQSATLQSAYAGDYSYALGLMLRAKADLLRIYSEYSLAQLEEGETAELRASGTTPSFASYGSRIDGRNQLRSLLKKNSEELSALREESGQSVVGGGSGLLLVSEFQGEAFDRGAFKVWADAFDARLLDDREGFLAELYQLEFEGIRSALSDGRRLHSDALEQSAGLADESGINRRYPNRALELLALASQAASAARLRFEPTRDYGQEQDWHEDSPVFEEGQPLIVQLGRELAALESDIAAADSLARAQIAESERFVLSGNEAIAQARAAIAQRNVELAGTRLELAAEAYLSALERYDNPATRSRFNEFYASVAEEIQNLGNEIALDQINELLNRAQNAYNQDLFADALSLVVQAEDVQSRHPSLVPNPFIADLRDRISSANSVARERVLDESDPLYNTVSQLLNSAQVNIDAGVRQLEQSNINAATRHFDLAQASIDNTLFVKAFNFRAKILALRIIQVTQTQAQFTEIFRTRYNDTVSRMRLADDSGVDILNELEALYNINPNYPGLLSNLNAMKIRLGIMEDPITAARQAEATTLVARARQLLINADRPTLEAALALADQARGLDRTNGSAALLSDEIRVRLGRATTASLSADDTFKFRQAQQLFSQRNLTEAGTIVNTLWAVPDNQNYPPLRTLRANIFGGAN